MSADYTFSRFVYFDTNIISDLVKSKHLWRPLFDFLEKNDLTLGLSGAQVVELSDVKKLHEDLVALFLGVPCALLKPWNMVLDEEVKAHPHERKESLLLYPLNAMLLEPKGVEKLQDLLSSRELCAARSDQLNDAGKMAQSHAQLKDNFPLSNTGKYTRNQADEFAWMEVMQWLACTHHEFLVTFQNNIESFHPEVFLSIRLLAHVIFYKYYLGQREPKKLSDFGDLAHLASIPYCELAVMERDLCNILNQIKRNHDTLKYTVVRNIEFLKDWSWR
jgi:hypothetical protein